MSPRPLLDTVVFGLTRITPALIALTVVRFPVDPAAATLFVQRILVLASLILAWNVAEGTFAVYLQKRDRSPSTSRGYLFATFLFGIVVLGLFGVFRSCSTQGLFLLLLAVLSLRGMGRVGWDQDRLRLSMACTLAAHTLLALLSLLCASEEVEWQKGVFALGIGLSTCAVELAWHSSLLSAPATARIAAPLFRISLVGGPLAIASLAFTSQLPFCYTATYLALLPALRVLSSLRRSGQPLPGTIRGSAGVFGIFLGIMVACRAYLSAGQ